MNIGDRVKIVVQDYDKYATGCAECLDGVTGTIKEIKQGGSVLVSFDKPAKTWWTHQTPPTSFHIPKTDLMVVRPELMQRYDALNPEAKDWVNTEMERLAGGKKELARLVSEAGDPEK